MNRLIEDKFVRRFSQLILTIFVLGGGAISFIFVLIVIAVYLGVIDGDEFFASKILQVIATSSRSDFSTFLTPALSAMPVMFAAACFSIDLRQSPPRSSEHLNFTGHIIMLLLFAGLFLSILSLILAVNLANTINDIVPSSAQSVKSIFVALGSFQAMYLLQLMGLKPK